MPPPFTPSGHLVLSPIYFPSNVRLLPSNGGSSAELFAGSVSNRCQFTFTMPTVVRFPTACIFVLPLWLTPSHPLFRGLPFLRLGHCASFRHSRNGSQTTCPNWAIGRVVSFHTTRLLEPSLGTRSMSVNDILNFLSNFESIFFLFFM